MPRTLRAVLHRNRKTTTALEGADIAREAAQDAVRQIRDNPLLREREICAQGRAGGSYRDTTAVGVCNRLFGHATATGAVLMTLAVTWAQGKVSAREFVAYSGICHTKAGGQMVEQSDGSRY